MRRQQPQRRKFVVPLAKNEDDRHGAQEQDHHWTERSRAVCAWRPYPGHLTESFCPKTNRCSRDTSTTRSHAGSLRVDVWISRFDAQKLGTRPSGSHGSQSNLVARHRKASASCSGGSGRGTGGVDCNYRSCLHAPAHPSIGRFAQASVLRPIRAEIEVTPSRATAAARSCLMRSISPTPSKIRPV